MKAGEKENTSRFKRLFNRSKKAPKQKKNEEDQTTEETPAASQAPKKPSGFNARFSITNIRKKMKETEKRERALETTRIKIITLIMTFIAMGLAFSLIPLLSQPLPILLALLVAFVTWQKPRIGMPVGSIIIGIGLLYHLSVFNADDPVNSINFIALIGEPVYRFAFAGVLMGLFVALPIIFYRYRHAIAIDFGILAAMSLASNQTYFLAIPLILTAVVFYKKDAVVAAVYYGLITIPLMIVEYFKFYIAQTTAVEWWKAPGSAPPLFEPLTKTFNLLQSTTMGSFRLFNANQLTDTITYQFLPTTNPDIVGKTMRSAIIQYRDSFPGILLFVVIIVGVVLALMVFGVGFVKKTNIAYGDRVLTSLVATVATALFFVFLGALQNPLAYTAKVDGTTTALATLATLAFTLPISMINYQPKKNATADMIAEKANELMVTLQAFETQLNIVKTSIPVNVSATDVKMMLLKDKLNDIQNKISKGFYEPSEMDKIFNELDKNISVEIDGLVSELNAILSEYQIFVNTEYASWLGRLKDDIGLEFKASMKPHYEADLPLEERIQSIQDVLDAGRVLAVDVIQVVNPIYEIITVLYDPSLPKDSEAVAYSKMKLDERAPWQAVEALYVALNNWRKQYGDEIAKSTEYLKNSLKPIIDLPLQSGSLGPVLGDKMPMILGDAKKASLIKDTSEKKQLNVLNLLTIEYLLDGVLDISKDVFSILNEALNNQEKDIVEMLPTSNYLWEKNATLNERMTEALTVLSEPKKQSERNYGKSAKIRRLHQ